tara:strand:+ start:3565 stop:4455 length:891 start_codon:yes stop_codon:yes gene_type:complete
MENSIREIADDWLEEPSKNERQRKHPNEIHRCNIITNYFGNKKFSELERRDAHEFKKYLKNSLGLSESTIQRYISTFNAIMNFGLESGLSSTRIQIKTKQVKGKETYLEPNELKKFIGQLDTLRANIAEFLTLTGQRKANVINLKWSSLSDDLKEWTQSSDEMKNAEPNVLGIGTSAQNVLKRMWDRKERIEQSRPYLRGKIEYVFVQDNGKPLQATSLGNKRWKKAVQNSGVKKNITPHTLRHTFATLLAKDGVDIYQIKEAGGWKDLKSVTRYAHVNTAKKREIVGRLDAVLLQ